MKTNKHLIVMAASVAVVSVAMGALTPAHAEIACRKFHEDVLPLYEGQIELDEGKNERTSGLRENGAEARDVVELTLSGWARALTRRFDDSGMLSQINIYQLLREMTPGGELTGEPSEEMLQLESTTGAQVAAAVATKLRSDLSDFQLPAGWVEHVNGDLNRKSIHNRQPIITPTATFDAQTLLIEFNNPDPKSAGTEPVTQLRFQALVYPPGTNLESSRLLYSLTGGIDLATGAIKFNWEPGASEQGETAAEKWHAHEEKLVKLLDKDGHFTDYKRCRRLINRWRREERMNRSGVVNDPAQDR